MDWRNSYPIFLLLALVSVNRAAPLPIPQYKVGDTAAVDILTPVHLIVIDHARTEQLRQQEAQRTPAIYWFYPDEIDEAEANLRSAIDSRRENFLNLLEASYARRNLNDVAVALPRFQRLVGSFQKQSNAFPVSASLAEVWALGAFDDFIRTNLAGKLRQAMERHIEADSLPPEAKIGPLQVRMLPGKLKETGLDLAQIEKQATNFFRTDIVGLAQASKEVQSAFAPEERGWGEFLATLVRENCAWDAELTRKSRKAKTDSIWAADEYEPGQLVVKRGDLIDARIKAVLDQLRERAAGEQARKDLVKGQSEAETAVARFHEQAVRAQTSAQITAEQNRWLLGGLAGAFVALLFVIWRLARWKRSNSLLPAKVRNNEIAGTVISCPACAGVIVLPLELAGPASTPAPASMPALPSGALNVAVPEEAAAENWKERALAAERRVANSEQVLRTALIPHLARWLMNKLVRALTFQRTHLLETQKQAEQELAELDQRLASVQAPLEDRLKAYEQRIAELEKNLTAKGEENRELIKATIAMARKKLELERSKDRMAWN